jgi:membrane-bound metal-dependent hydrolase YbcI (DUF457 family)
LSRLPLRRFEPALLAVALVGVVCGLDLLWALSGFSTGSLAYGLVDEPAHLATCAVALLALVAVAGLRVSPSFCAAALFASVAIDLDHLPQYLGWDAITAGTPRPYAHSAIVVAVLLFAALASRGRRRSIALGLAFGVGAHLLRDLATGPGIALALPFSTSPAQVPYPAYAVTLVLLGAAILLAYRRGRGPRLRSGAWMAVRARWGVAALLAAVVLAVPAASPDTAPGQVKAAVVVKKRHLAPAQISVGVYIPGAEQNPALLDGYANAVGRQPAIVHTYRKWWTPIFEPQVLGALSSRGAIPMVTWEPWNEKAEGVSLWGIAAGEQDAYIAQAAQQAASWGGPLFVRFAHEMNGDWYPWGRGHSDNSAVAYKTAWRHIVEVFRREGALNVRWVWTPYVDGGRVPFRQFYPGDEWVDWAGLDGFNWGRPFMSFAKVFDRSYQAMVRLTSKPLMIAETGSVEAGGNKAIWIRDALRRAMPHLKHVRALLWWSDVHPSGADWRINTSPGALAALQQALGTERFASGPSFLLARPPWLNKR